MSNFKDEDRIKALRERLYSRGKAPEKREKYKLKDEPVEVPTSWQTPPNEKKVEIPLNTPAPKPAKEASPTQEDEFLTTTETASMAPRKKYGYRIKILLAGIAFFILAVAASSLFFLAGGNNISGENISIDISGPFTIGGGEAIPLQIGITNQNTVDIDSATLIVRYPSGTQSATEEGKELFVERLPLDTIASGETLNIPLRALVFGEENEEKTISAEIEYRVLGSNSTFAKEAEPLRFKISSSPVVLSVDSVHKISSGQETDIVIEVSSNSPNSLVDILVKADYPSGFDFSSASPAPDSGQNTWLIKSLDPEESTTITLTGVVVGKETDEYAMHFSVGVPNENDRLSLASVFSTASTDFVIEQPFIAVGIELNDDSSGTVAVEAGEDVDVVITVENTLEDTIYDGRIELSLSGNALTDYSVNTSDGFYDSRNNTVFWDASSLSVLREIPPGEEVSVSVNLQPSPDIEKTPQLAFDVDVRARRVTEGRASEELIGTAVGVVKVSSVAVLMSEAGRNTSTFSDSGPIPPVAEEETSYTLTLFIENGSNDIGDAEVIASLPAYVAWENVTSGAGTITFNETARTVTWRIGDVDANQSKIAALQVTLLPSVTQIGTTPTLLGEQRLRATDRFTGSIVRTTKAALTSELAEEAGFEEDNGQVRRDADED